MPMQHHYRVTAQWNGNRGKGTTGVRDYDRSHTINIEGKPELLLTTDNPQVGDKTKLNPEDLLVSAISSCHMLSYLYVCANEGVIVTAYRDEATGTMEENENGSGCFKEVTLNPKVVVAEKTMVEKAIMLHERAHQICFIANSVNFEVKCFPACDAVN